MGKQGYTDMGIAREVTHLLIPMIPRLRNDRLERRKFFVRHRQCPQQMLLEERGAREGEEERARERLAAQWLALREWGLVHGVWLRVGMRGHLVRHDGLVLALGVHPVLHLVHARHYLVAHVEPELAQLAGLDQRAVLPLPFPRGGPDPVSLRELLRRQLALVLVLGHELLLLGRMLRGQWWDLDRWLLGQLLGLLREREDVALNTRLAVALALAALSFCCFLPLVSLARGLVLARPLAR